MDDNQKTNRREWQAVCLSFLYFFCVLAAYYVMRPIREQLSAAAGSTQLPWFFGATFVVTLILTPIFSWAASKWPRRILVPIVYVFFIVCLLAFTPLFSTSVLPPTTLGVIFFVWVSIFNLFVVSVFWSFMSDIWSDEQARRLFPIIALGGTAGAIVGPIITRFFVDIIGVAPLLIVSAAFLSVVLLCIICLGQWARQYGTHRPQQNSENALGGSMFDGLKLVFKNPFIRNMSFLMVLGDTIGTIAYVLVTNYSNMTFSDAISRTRFAADVDLATNTLQVIVQLTLSRWLLMRYGAATVIVTCVTIGILTCLSMSWANNPYTPILGPMPWVALFLIITRALTHAMMQPARESLFTLVPRELRYKGKNAVDTAVWRGGDLISSLSINGLHALGMAAAGFGLIGAGLLATSGLIGWRLAKQAERHAFERHQ